MIATEYKCDSRLPRRSKISNILSFFKLNSSEVEYSLTSGKFNSKKIIEMCTHYA